MEDENDAAHEYSDFSDSSDDDLGSQELQEILALGASNLKDIGFNVEELQKQVCLRFVCLLFQLCIYPFAFLYQRAARFYLISHPKPHFDSTEVRLS